MRRIAAIFAFVTLWMSVTPSARDDAVASTPGPITPGPNIVLILTDDQTAYELDQMQTVQSELVGKGVTFTNAFVSNSLCCPSRTSILTGKYSHGTGVYRNQPPWGGFATFRPEDASTIATWLHDGPSSYYTGLVGKYLNGYDSTYEPPGWDSWDAEIVGDSPQGGYYDYNMSVDGQLMYYGSQETDYSTDVLAQYATNFISSAPAGKPLFLYFAPHAPHAPATPPARYLSAVPHLPPHPQNFNEADMSDKPPWAQSLPPLSPRQIRDADDFHRDQYRSLLAVDDAVSEILGALSTTGRLSDTLIVFTSDNGLELGSHRWIPKAVPWEEAIRVPMVIRYDPVTGGTPRADGHMVLNIDLAPTFADVGHVAAPGAEGSSLLPLLTGQATEWRDAFLLEHLPGGEGDPGDVPAYCAIRTERYLYVRYEKQDGDMIQMSEELYDLAADPYELSNQAGNPAYAILKDALHLRMVGLCSPPPPGFIP